LRSVENAGCSFNPRTMRTHKPHTHIHMKNYIQIVRSFIRFQKKEGFSLISSTDGTGSVRKHDHPTASAEWACSCEEGALTFEKEGHLITAFVILGNDACETVADWSWKANADPDVLKAFERAWEAWEARWEEPIGAATLPEGFISYG